MNKKIAELLQKRAGTLKNLKITSGIIKGSPVVLARACGGKNCHCRKGKKHISLYLSRSVKSKTTMAYIPRKYEDFVKKAVSEHKRILKVLDKLSEINLRIIKERGDI